MDFNFDTGSIFGGIQTIDTSILPPLGGQAGILDIIGTGALGLPAGTTAERPVTPVAAMLRYNNDTDVLEYHNGVVWSSLSVGGGTVTSVAVSGSTGIGVSGSPITSSGTIALTLDTGLQNLASYASTGLVVATGADTWGSASIAGTAGNIDVTNGSGVAGNPTVDLATVSQAASGSFVKVTLDGFGRVAGNTPVVTSDITALVDSTYVNVSGDTMTGNLNMGGTFTVTGLANPVNGSDAANKNYVDSVSSGISWKTSVIAGTTVNGTLATSFEAGDVIDGVTLVAGMRILIKDQTALAENGIYVVQATGAPVRATDMDSTTPTNEINGAAVFIEQGTTNANTAWVQKDNVQTLGTDPVEFVQFAGAGSYTAGNGLTLTGTQFSLTSPVSATNGGTGIDTSTATNGQLLIGNGTGLSLSTITAGSGVSVTNGAGSITIANTGVTSITGTSFQIDASASTGAVTLSVPSTFIAPGSIRATTTLQVIGNIAKSFLYSDNSLLVQTTAAPLDGELLIGSTGNSPVKSAITAGTGIIVTNGPGSITLSADTSALVSSFSAGTTGFTPNTATSGAVTLAGTLNVANGGTGLSTIGSANQVLGVNSAGTASEYKTLAAGTGMSVVHGTNVVTFNNTGVTSVALSLPSIFTVSGSPVTTTGTLTGSLVTQSANTIFAGPASGGAAAPTFRALTAADLGSALQLYTENAVTPTTPISTGTNSVAIGSSSTATAEDGFAVGDGTNARIVGMKAFANGKFGTDGDAQHGIYIVRNITTDSTLTELFINGTSEQIVMPNNSVFAFDILVAARRTDATGGGAAYRFVGVARKDATSGSVTFIGTPSKTVVGETNNAWDAAVSVDTTTGAFRVRVTGENAKTIRWVATVQTTEITN